MSTLVLIRHGQSQWNLENRFTGWTDVQLSPQGEKDIVASGKALKLWLDGKKFDHAFTSRLTRAQKTLEAVLAEIGQTGLVTEYDSALNERHYGDLQGLDKGETAKKYGDDQVKLWRRSYATRPPHGESLEDCERRTVPFFVAYVLPLLAAGKNVIIAAHGNSLKPIFKYLDHLDPENVATMEVGLCLPYIYTFEGTTPVKKEVLSVPEIKATGTADIHAGKKK